MIRAGLPQRLRLLLLAGAAAASFCGDVAQAQEREFPFDQELRLDARPMRGSRRVPIFEIGPGGQTEIELWCSRVEGQFVVAQDTVTVITGERQPRNCTPEQQQGDDDLLEALSQVTNWRRERDVVTLIGPRTLRLRVPTN